MDTGNTAWILTSTALVLFMTLPGLALFYGGLVRSRNVLSVFMQTYSIACLMSVIWLVVGYLLIYVAAILTVWSMVKYLIVAWPSLRSGLTEMSDN